MIQNETFSRAYRHVVRKSGLLTLSNRLMYGWNAPVPEIRLTVPLNMLRDRYYEATNHGIRMPHWRSGQIIGGDWDLHIRTFGSSLKYRSCYQHFINGVPWDETPAIPYGMKRIATQNKYDNCFNAADLRVRYARLDDLWEKTIAAKTLPGEISANARLRDSIVVHMKRDGGLVFGNQGFHRLAIAHLAKLDSLTVLLGVTHRDAVLSGVAAKVIKTYRNA